MLEKIEAIEQAVWSDSEAYAKEMIVNLDGMFDFKGYDEENGMNPVAGTAVDYADASFVVLAKVRAAFDLPTIDHKDVYPIPEYLKAEFPEGFY